MTEEENILFMLNKGQQPNLSNTVESLKARITTYPPGIITLPPAANHLEASVSKFLDYIDKNCTIIGVDIHE